MGERDRAAKYKEAERKGALAADVGQTTKDCPYKIGPWSLRPFWMLGFNNTIKANALIEE